MKRRNKVTTLDQKQQQREVQEAFKQNQIDYEQKLAKYLAADEKHKRPTSRRDFLEVGFWASSVSLMGPSIETLLGRLNSAGAATLDCPDPAATNSVPFLHIHVSGGTHPLGYITPRAADGSLLDNYNRLGLGPTPTFTTDAFGNGAEIFDNQQNGANAGFYTGWMQSTTAAIRQNSAAFVLPWSDNGDSDGFPFSIMGLVAASGQSGQKMGVLGTNASQTGNDAGIGTAYNIFAATPLRVQNLASITNAVSFAGALNQLNANQKSKLVRTIQNLSDAQKAKIMGVSGGENAAKLIECATGQNVKNVDEGAGAIDPRAGSTATQMAAIWNNFNPLVTAGNKTFANDVHSLIAFNVANGNASAGSINIGNHDQHASHNNRQEQEQSAYAIAKLVGQSISTAALLGKKMMIQITMNGSCVNSGGTPVSMYNNDDNQGDCSGGSLLFFYDPAGKVKTIQSPTLGAVVKSTNPGQNGRVDTTQLTSNVLMAQTAVFYNYCLFRGDTAAFTNLLPGRLTTAQMGQVARILKS